MWVKTQSVCVEQRQELAWDLQQKHDKVSQLVNFPKIKHFQEEEPILHGH